MKRILKLGGILIIFIVSIYLVNNTNLKEQINTYIKLIDPTIYIFLLFITIYFWIFSLNNKSDFKIFLVIYIVFLIINLFFRKQYEFNNINTKFYLIDWLKLITKNKIVFINIIGNIFLFIPLGYIYKYYKINLIFGIISILLIEIIQYYTKLGIFDFTDIFLNSIGIILGLLIKRGNTYE